MPTITTGIRLSRNAFRFFFSMLFSISSPSMLFCLFISIIVYIGKIC